jgi:putative DNA primase/helicase
MHDCNIVSLSGIEPRSVEWLWPDRIPLGMFSLLAGNPGVGKSTIAFTIAAIVSNGGKWPFSDQNAAPGEVIILTSEDDAQYTIVPRLIAAGADRSRIHMIQSVMRPHEETVVNAPLLLSKDMHQLHGALEQYPNTRLMIFDPISAYLGVKDSHRDSDVRQVLGPLTDLAAQHGVAVLGITHLNKAAGSSAIARFMGSTGIIAAARSAYMALKHEDELLFLPVKSNVARDDVGGLVYQIEGTRIQEEIETSRIEWTGTTDLDVN